MAISKEQQTFLEQLALRIPLLFEAIRAGNVKSEYIIGVRRIGHRHVQLKMIAEVVDAGSNPLQTHGMQAPVTVSVQAELIPGKLIRPGNHAPARSEKTPLSGVAAGSADTTPDSARRIRSDPDPTILD